MQITVAGHRVFLVNGPTTQTVNVCDANNRRGQYDWIVRLARGTVTAEAIYALNHKSIAEFIDWLKSQAGAIEAKPFTEADLGAANASDAEASPVDWRGYDAATDDWLRQAREVVEHNIDHLVREFLESPYLHRVEHSLHCRLFSMLVSDPRLAETISFGEEKTVTQPVHKEWPETIPREARRRGNFDLAVIPPKLLRIFTRDEFREGRLPAPLAIEIGLDYDWAHLANDHEKLLKSHVPYAYLIHFERDSEPHPRVIELLENTSGFEGRRPRAAYACVARGSRWHKPLNGTKIAQFVK